MLERFATSLVAIGPYCDPTIEKNRQTLKTLSSLHKVYSLQQFVSNWREEERESERWINRVSWAKKNSMSWGERDSRHIPRIFFLVFCCSFNMLACWLCLHGFAYGAWGLFLESIPKMRLVNFLLLTPSWLVPNCPSLPRPHFSLTPSKLSRLLPSTRCRLEEHPFSLVPHIRRKPVNSSFLKSSSTHLPMTDWPTSALASEINCLPM